MTDGHVPFRRERRYGEHGRVGRHLGEQPSELAEYLTEYVRIPVITFSLGNHAQTYNIINRIHYYIL